jgi:hypothetical protein
MEKIVVVDLGESLIMPPVTLRIPMPQGAAVPAQAPAPLEAALAQSRSPSK